MDFKLTEEQVIFRQSVERFARNEIAPGMEERETRGEFSAEIWRKIADFGLTGLCIPEAYGGAGADAVTTVVAMEALARGSRDFSLIGLWTTHLLLSAMPIAELGSEEQQRRYLPAMAIGEKIGAFALTEPTAGSDAASLKTTAKRDGDVYRLNGSKTFISNSSIADVFVVFASTDLAKRAGGLSIFLVDRDTPGLTVGKPLKKRGGGAAWPTGELFFDDCKVPVMNRLGEEGTGFKSMLMSLGWERLAFTPIVGLMEADLLLCIEYSRERKQFGQPIGSFQLVQAMLAEMKMDLEASRHLAYHLAWKKDAGADIGLDAAIAKTFITEAAERSARKAVQVFGGYGAMQEYPVGDSLWISKIATIGGGTSQMQRLIIGKMLTGL